MDTRGGYTVHRVFTCALFILGNTVIFLPKSMGILDLIIAFIIGFFLALAFNLILKKLDLKKCSKALSVLVLPFLLFFFLNCCRDYVIFTDSTKMPNTSAAIIAVFFTVLSIYGGICHREALLRLSIIIFIASAFILTLLILFSVPLIKPSPLDLTVNYKSIISLLISAFIPSLAVTYFIKGEHKRHSALLSGVILGSLLLVFIFLLCRFVLGGVTDVIGFPLATVGGTVSIGKGFLRFEGFVYLFTMLTSFIKAAVIFFLIKKASLNIHKNFYKAMLFILPLLAAFVSII